MLLLLLAFQLPADSTYSTPALRDVVERAAVYNAAASAQLRPFAAQYQSSVGVVRRLPDNVEGSATIEQMAGIFRWTPDGVFQQHQTGYRVITVGVPLPGASLLANGWVLAPLVGERLLVLAPIALMFVLGLWPQLVLGVMDATVMKMVQQLNF